MELRLDSIAERARAVGDILRAKDVCSRYLHVLPPGVVDRAVQRQTLIEPRGAQTQFVVTSAIGLDNALVGLQATRAGAQPGRTIQRE